MAISEAILKYENAYKLLIYAKKIKHRYTPSVKHQDLFRYVVSSETNQKIAVEGLNMSCMSFPWTCLKLFLASAKSSDITIIFVKSILQKFAFIFAYDIVKSPEHFETKNKESCPI